MREKTSMIRLLRDSEQGASLVVVLCVVMILSMSLIGFTGMQTTTLQEKMAGNLRDHDLAFQAAEAGLRAGEIFLQAASLPAFDNNNGLYQPPSPSSASYPLWKTIIWSSDTTSKAYAGTLQGVPTPPRYIIEEMPTIEVEGESAKFGAVPDTALYRVTARGTGGTANAVVILQGTFRR